MQLVRCAPPLYFPGITRSRKPYETVRCMWLHIVTHQAVMGVAWPTAVHSSSFRLLTRSIGVGKRKSLGDKKIANPPQISPFYLSKLLGVKSLILKGVKRISFFSLFLPFFTHRSVGWTFELVRIWKGGDYPYRKHQQQNWKKTFHPTTIFPLQTTEKTSERNHLY